MKAHMVLAEAVTTHPDGTMSLLRGWINRLEGPAPVVLRAMLAVRIESDIGDGGPHHFDLRCLDQDGKETLPPIEGDFEAQNSRGTTGFVLGMNAPFSKSGSFVFVLRVDRVQLQEWSIEVKIQKSQGKK